MLDDVAFGGLFGKLAEIGGKPGFGPRRRVRRIVLEQQVGDEFRLARQGVLPAPFQEFPLRGGSPLFCRFPATLELGSDALSLFDQLDVGPRTVRTRGGRRSG